MTLRDALLPVLEATRGIGGTLGFRVFSVVALRTVTWSGARVGLGTATSTDVPLTVAFGASPPKVRQRSQQDILRSGGDLSTAQYVIGRISPAFTGGGFTPEQLDPSAGARPTEIFVKLLGPGTAATGDWCVKVGDAFDRPMHYTITVAKTAERPFGA